MIFDAALISCQLPPALLIWVWLSLSGCSPLAAGPRFPACGTAEVKAPQNKLPGSLLSHPEFLTSSSLPSSISWSCLFFLPMVWPWASFLWPSDMFTCISPREGSSDVASPLNCPVNSLFPFHVTIALTPDLSCLPTPQQPGFHTANLLQPQVYIRKSRMVFDPLRSLTDLQDLKKKEKKSTSVANNWSWKFSYSNFNVSSALYLTQLFIESYRFPYSCKK